MAERNKDRDIKTLARTDPMDAYEAVIQRYQSRLEHHAAGIVKDRQEARDAVQEVFIKAMREQRFFDPEFEVRAWLFRVTSNLCYNIVRDKRRRSGILASMDRELVPQGKNRRVRVEVYQDQLRRGLQEAMAELSEHHREILMLRYYKDLSYREIAATLEIQLGTVMSRLSRARTRLGAVMGPEHPLSRESGWVSSMRAAS